MSSTPQSPSEQPAPPPLLPRRWVEIRREIPPWRGFFYGFSSLALFLGVWWLVTRGETAESRIISKAILPSPWETFRDFRDLWFDQALTRNTLASLRRVATGFGLAALVGIPLGVLAGCFRGVGAFFSPLLIVGRNVPVAALIPLTFSLFGIDEFQKVMFIFIACVAFVMSDSARAVNDISDRYIDTAYTLGASRRQMILKVLFPLAMPGIFNSLRLLFGLAFGYIMLAEVVQVGGSGGLGGNHQPGPAPRRHPTYILLVLMIIPLVALGIDRMLFWIQRELFPYQLRRRGILHRRCGESCGPGKTPGRWSSGPSPTAAHLEDPDLSPKQ
jgi:ABC-type nitrate/sulfonate/bicarbonate transport system permease component